MCWIAIVSNNTKVKSILSQQKDRWLDSVGIINKDCIYQVIRDDLDWYNKYIEDEVKNASWLTIVHHRRATIGGVNIKNTHPFIGEKFVLVQNGTSRKFHYQTEYNNEVDSNNLLHFIEENAKTIDEIPAVLDLFTEEYKDIFGILIICDMLWNCIFISDWERESYIKIKWNKVKQITNYRGEDRWYKNVWYIIFNLETSEIIEKYFTKKINSELFYKYVAPKTNVLPAKTTTANDLIQQSLVDNTEEEDDFYDEYYNSYIWSNYREEKKTKDDLETEDIDEDINKDDLIATADYLEVIEELKEWTNINRWLFPIHNFDWILEVALMDLYWCSDVYEYENGYWCSFPIKAFKDILSNNNVIVWE